MSLFIIIIFLITIVCVVSIVAAISKTISSVGSTILGVTDVIATLSDLNEEFIQPPRSISAMTRVYLPNINKDYPDFHYQEMRERAESLLESYFLAINNSKASLLTEGSTELRNQLQFRINNNVSLKRKERITDFKIHQTEIKNYEHSNGKVVITFQSSIALCNYYTDKNDSLIKGDSSKVKQTLYNISVFYVQDNSKLNSKEQAIGMTCPNCGAPITTLGSTVCEYCDSRVVAINRHSWIFGEIEEDSKCR